MAMNGNTLGSAIDTAIKALTSKPGDATYSADVWKAVSNQIVSHIINNMVINIPANPNTGITISSGTVTSQGTDSAQTVGNGTGIS